MNDTDAVAERFAYTPFGEVIESVVGNPMCNIPVGFAGQFGVLGEPNGLYYMNARYYDPTMGRFLSEDPIGLSGGDLTLYSYAGNNPVVFVDPSGLCRTSGGMDVLRSPRFDADGNIQLNRRGLLGSFGVPIAGGIAGVGTATTAGVTGLYLAGPTIGAEVVVPAANLAYRYRAGIQAAGEAILPTPYPIVKSLPELGAATLLEVGSWVYDNWGTSSGYIAPATDPFAPDATRIGW